MLNFTRLLTMAWFLTIPGHAGAVVVATSGSVHLNPGAGSWVGRGIDAGDVIWTYGDEGLFSIAANFDQGASAKFNDRNFRSSYFAGPTFAPPANANNGNHLGVGFYANATRFPFNSPTHPGMNVSGNAGSPASEIPVPASVWLFGSGLVGVLSGVTLRKK